MVDNRFNTVYAQEIFKLAEEKKDEMFYNSSSEHATIVHQALTKYATQYIDIFSSSMCTEISNNATYCNLIRDFLGGDASRKINIIFTDYSNGFHEKQIALLLSQYPQQVSVKSYPGRIMYKGAPVHFTVSDDRAFRLETDIAEHMAFGNFNSPKQANALKMVFEKIFNSSLVKEVCLKN